MEINFFHKNLSKMEEEAFSKYVEGKKGAVEGLLNSFPKDAKILKVTIEKFDKHDAYEVEMCLILPTKSMVAKETSHSITKAVDLSKDRLIAQIKKHMSMLRRDRAHRSIRETEKAMVEEEIQVE